MLKKRKCAVIGIGAVGSAAVYAILTSCDGLISELVLLDINKNLAFAEATDISHALPFTSSSHTKVYAGEYSDLKDADIIVITAGAAQKDGKESRLELVKKNLYVTEEICKKISEVQSSAIIIMVTNPVDILTYAAIKNTGLDRTRVFGTGCVLDTARLKYELGKYFEIDSKNIHAFICGEHGDSEFPIWSGANISGINLVEYCRHGCRDCNSDALNNIFESVKKSAYKIIDGKGATAYGIASSVAKTVSVVLKNENSVLPVSVLLKGEYGINDVALSVPCVVGSEGIREIMETPLSEEEYKRLHISAQTLDEIIMNCGLSERKHAYKSEFIV